MGNAHSYLNAPGADLLERKKLKKCELEISNGVRYLRNQRWWDLSFMGKKWPFNGKGKLALIKKKRRKKLCKYMWVFIFNWCENEGQGGEGTNCQLCLKNRKFTW